MRDKRSALSSYRGSKTTRPRSIMVTDGKDEIIALELNSNFCIIYSEDVTVAELYEMQNGYILGTTKSLLRGGKSFKVQELWELCSIYYEKPYYELKIDTNRQLENEIYDFIYNVECKIASNGTSGGGYAKL